MSLNNRINLTRTAAYIYIMYIYQYAKLIGMLFGRPAGRHGHMLWIYHVSNKPRSSTAACGLAIKDWNMHCTRLTRGPIYNATTGRGPIYNIAKKNNTKIYHYLILSTINTINQLFLLLSIFCNFLLFIIICYKLIYQIQQINPNSKEKKNFSKITK